ncbi:hypothetical protein KA005_13670, partial [bacterium]|nr:hypothetical protein [bacterium]
MSNAVIYVAWGDEFVAMAEKSLQSLKKYAPFVKAYLFTDELRSPTIFDRIEIIKIYANRAQTKANGIRHSCNVVNEHNVLYLDSDTLILGDISGLFEVMEWFEIA